MSPKKARLGGDFGNRGEIVRKAWMIAAKPQPAEAEEEHDQDVLFRPPAHDHVHQVRAVSRCAAT